MLLQDWKVVRKFSAFNQTRDYELSFELLPNFDIWDLPIVVARSKNEICLLNTNHCSIEKLVTKTPLDCNIKGSFLVFKEGSEFKLHFISRNNHQFAEETVKSW